MKPISKDRKQWAHIVCVNWTPEIWFTDENVDQLGGAIQSERFKLACKICKKI